MVWDHTVEVARLPAPIACTSAHRAPVDGAPEDLDDIRERRSRPWPIRDQEGARAERGPPFFVPAISGVRGGRNRAGGPWKNE